MRRKAGREMKNMGSRREIIVYVDKELTKKERKNYKKENPGKRLCLRLRYPNFLKYIMLISYAVLFLSAMIRILQ